MSRIEEYEDDYSDGPPPYGRWAGAARAALQGKRGRQALLELREALQALPQKRLIARALCTVDPASRLEKELEPDPYRRGGWVDGELSINKAISDLFTEQGEGVCAVGAYAWYQKVKAGADPWQAFAELPTLHDVDNTYSTSDTTDVGTKAGLTYVLAWHLAEENDEGTRHLTPEQRYDHFLRWIDEKLAAPPLTWKRKPPRVRKVAAKSERPLPEASAARLPL